MAAAAKRKRVVLTVEQKRQILQYSSTRSETQQSLADTFSKKFGLEISRRQVGDILANKDVILGDTKSCKQPAYPKVDEAVGLWFTQMRLKNLVITGPLIKEKARLFAAKFGVDDAESKFTDGWLKNFKKRNGIFSRQMQGECASVDTSSDIFQENLAAIREIVSQYVRENVFNMDETGLFFAQAPSRTLTTKEMVSGGKVMKNRITVALCSNSTGSVKIKPLIIGQSKSPRCFKNFKPELYCSYFANKKAWMTSEIFTEWLKQFDLQMLAEGRKALLLLDNAPSHIFDTELKSTRIAFLPPNSTSVLQPMDAGIIRTFKAYYKKLFLRWTLDQAETEEDLSKLNLKLTSF